MATGSEHYLEAEKLLRIAAETEHTKLAADCQQAAQVHATLALAAATALHGSPEIGQPVDDDMAWRRVAATTRTTTKD